MPAGSKVTAEEVARWRELRELGWTFQRIGDATGRHAVTVWDHLNGKLQGPPRERIIMPEEVARWRELRRRGWTYQRIAAGSGWTEAAVYMRLTGRGARSELTRTAPTLRPASTVTSESGPLRTSRPRGRIARLLSRCTHRRGHGQ